MKNFGSTSGLTILAEDQATPANGMVNYITSSYQSGWQNGDIKGAFLSSTDTASLVGGSISTDTYSLPTGWSFSAGTLSYDGSATQYTEALNTLSEPVVVGRAYRAKFTVAGLAVGEHMNLKTPGFTTAQNTFGADGTYEVYLIAATASGKIGFQNNFAAQTFTVTGVSLDPADADRSVNSRGLIVNGTVTRTPVATGADLVAYSGFSSSNYLEQPYNSALDFGTGDFCVMGWVNLLNPAASQYIVDRHDGGTGPRISLACVSSQWYFAASPSGGLSTTGVTNKSGWTLVSLVRKSGVLDFYVDGVSIHSVANTVNLSDTDAKLFVGLGAALTAPLAGSLALLRISATAPTAEQIRKIYEDEKVLFQENAACTLYGASDAVTALAHDPDTGLLHVGTSAGRSVFDGLERINNTTTSVSRAISASGGLVISK